MSELDFLISEHEWCVKQFCLLGIVSYYHRAMELERIMKEWEYNATVILKVA